MKIVIPGGFGFVGGRLGQRLASLGHDVVLGSRRARPAPAWLREGGVVRTDWDDAGSLEAACAGADVVIHAVGLGARESAEDPDAAFRVNAGHVERMVDAAARAGVRRFMYLSTAHVYSSPLSGRITEDTPLTNEHPYAASHAAGETAVLEATEAGSVDGVAVRLANGFGVPARRDADCWGLLVNDLCRQAVETRRLRIRRGDAVRDFVALSQVTADFVRMLDMASFAPLKGTVNLGSGRATTVGAMARLVQDRAADVLGYRPPVLSEAGQGSDAGRQDLEYGTLRPLPRPSDPEGAWRNEVDDLLRFCRTEFTESSPGSVSPE